MKIKQVGLSINEINEELKSIQASILYNKKNGFRYYMPSTVSQDAQRVYKALNLNRFKTPKIISV